MKYISVVILAALFVLCARYSWLPLVAYLVLFKFSAVGNIVQSLDRLLAAMLPFGWTGRKTVSSECGDQIKAGSPCRFCRVMCRTVGWMLRNSKHCEDSAS